MASRPIRRAVRLASQLLTGAARRLRAIRADTVAEEPLGASGGLVVAVMCPRRWVRGIGSRPLGIVSCRQPRRVRCPAGPLQDRTPPGSIPAPLVPLAGDRFRWRAEASPGILPTSRATPRVSGESPRRTRPFSFAIPRDSARGEVSRIPARLGRLFRRNVLGSGPVAPRNFQTASRRYPSRRKPVPKKSKKGKKGKKKR